MGKRHGQVGLVDLKRGHATQRQQLLLESHPGDCLGLLKKRRDVDKEPQLRLAANGLVNQLHDGKLGLASTAMQGKHGKPTPAQMTLALPRPGVVQQVNFLGHQERPS